MLLRAASSAQQLYWFVDDTLQVVVGQDQDAFWPLALGRHTIACCDDAGNATRIHVNVE